MKDPRRPQEDRLRDLDTALRAMRHGRSVPEFVRARMEADNSAIRDAATWRMIERSNLDLDTP